MLRKHYGQVFPQKCVLPRLRAQERFVAVTKCAEKVQRHFLLFERKKCFRDKCFQSDSSARKPGNNVSSTMISRFRGPFTQVNGVIRSPVQVSPLIHVRFSPRAGMPRECRARFTRGFCVCFDFRPNWFAYRFLRVDKRLVFKVKPL